MNRDDAILNYLQDRLDPEQRASFEVDMAQDASLASEVSLMQSVRSELATGPKHDKSDQVWDRLSATIDGAPLAANENRSPWRKVLQYAAACIIAVSAWQFAVVPRLGVPEAEFRAASEPSADFVLQVKFNDSATLLEIADLLGSFGGTISDGPSALGIVVLSFADAQTRSEALEALNSRNDLVEFVAE